MSGGSSSLAAVVGVEVVEWTASMGPGDSRGVTVMVVAVVVVVGSSVASDRTLSLFSFVIASDSSVGWVDIT
jgi:hypothetical protein